VEKYLLISDTHLGLYKSDDYWLNVVVSLFKEVKDVCFRKGIDTIIHLGDFFHEKKAVSSRTIDVGIDIIEDLRPINMILVTGNHDVFYKDRIKPTSLRMFDNYDHIEVVKDTISRDGMVFVPWSCPLKEGTFCFGHFEINGFHMNNTSICDKGNIDIEDFRSYQKVYSGHFHKLSTIENITYIGSPFQQTFNDVGDTRGYYIMDGGYVEQFIEFSGAPKFIRQHTEQGFQNITGNIVELIFDKDYGNAENARILEVVESLQPLKLKPNFTNIQLVEGDERMDERNIKLLNHTEIMEKYVEGANLPSSVKKKVLMDMLMKLKEEVV